MLKEKNKKVIFFLINSMENGGAERVLSNLLPILSRKYNIYLILLKESYFYDIPNNIKTIFLSQINNNLLMLIFFPAYVWKLKKLIKKHKPYKVISFLEIANFVNILVNKNAVISFRTSLPFFEKLGVTGKIYLVLIRYLYPKAKKIIVNSKENKIDLSRKLNISSHKITTIYNPINIEQIIKFKKLPPALPFVRNDKQKIFITVGRLDKQKNIPALIKSFQNMPKRNILLIIGDGPEKNNLKEIIKKHQLEKQVFLLGRQKNVYQYLNIADCFIFASQAEGFPNVLTEAMACNLLIITSDFKTGAREIIDPNLKFNTKIKYPHYGPNGILLSLDNFKKDFEKVDFEKLVQQQTALDKFSQSKIIQQWIELIKNI